MYDPRAQNPRGPLNLGLKPTKGQGLKRGQNLFTYISPFYVRLKRHSATKPQSIKEPTKKRKLWTKRHQCSLLRDPSINSSQKRRQQIKFSCCCVAAVGNNREVYIYDHLLPFVELFQRTLHLFRPPSGLWSENIAYSQLWNLRQVCKTTTPSECLEPRPGKWWQTGFFLNVRGYEFLYFLIGNSFWHLARRQKCFCLWNPFLLRLGKGLYPATNFTEEKSCKKATFHSIFVKYSPHTLNLLAPARLLASVWSPWVFCLGDASHSYAARSLIQFPV